MTQRQIYAVLGALMCGMLLAALDQTIVATSLPTIVGDLGGLTQLSWVVTSYLRASTLSTPLVGTLCALYARKSPFYLPLRPCPDGPAAGNQHPRGVRGGAPRGLHRGRRPLGRCRDGGAV